MRGVQRVAEQHDAVTVPAAVSHQGKVQPLHEVLRQQRLAVEMVAKYLLEPRARVALAHRVEAGRRQVASLHSTMKVLVWLSNLYECAA